MSLFIWVLGVEFKKVYVLRIWRVFGVNFFILVSGGFFLLLVDSCLSFLFRFVILLIKVRWERMFVMCNIFWFYVCIYWVFRLIVLCLIVGIIEGVKICILVLVVWVVGKLMKIWLFGFLLGKIDVKILVILVVWLEVDIFDVIVLLYDEVKIDNFVFLGGGFLVVCFSLVEKLVLIFVLIVVVVIWRKMVDVDKVVRFLVMEFCIICFFLVVFFFSFVVWEVVEVSFEKKFLSEGILEICCLLFLLVVIVWGFYLIIFINVLLICVFVWLVVFSFISFFCVFVFKFFGIGIFKFGDDFFWSDNIF